MFNKRHFCNQGLSSENSEIAMSNEIILKTLNDRLKFCHCRGEKRGAGTKGRGSGGTGDRGAAFIRNKHISLKFKYRKMTFESITSPSFSLLNFVIKYIMDITY